MHLVMVICTDSRPGKICIIANEILKTLCKARTVSVHG